jgi:hypothetical protein
LSRAEQRKFYGEFGDRLFEPIEFMGEFPITADETEQHRK